MDIRRLMIHGFLTAPYWFRKITGTGAFREGAYTYVDPSPVSSGNPLKQCLWRHYVRQFHESSCSVASVAMAVNAVATMIRGDAHLPLTQMDLLDNVSTGNWKKRMSEDGDDGKRGLPILLLGEVVKGSFDAFNIPYVAIETVPIPANPALREAAAAALKERLRSFETEGDGILIAHFDQGVVVPGLNIPHISPVGGFDMETSQVTILDVDRHQPGPYRVSFQRFFRGMAGPYHHIFRLLGFSGGGYVHVRL